MKGNKRLLLLLVLITSCNQSSSFSGNIDKESLLSHMLENYQLDASYQVKNNDGIKDFKLQYKYVNQSNESFYKSVRQIFTDGNPSRLIEEITVFEDEEGKAYTERVNLENIVEKNYNFISENFTYYNYHFYNPFSILNDDDFTKVDDNTYTLDNNKANVFISTFIQEEYVSLVNKATFKFIDDKLASIDIETKEKETYLSSFKIEVSNVSKTTIEHAKPYESSNEQTQLTEAFKTIGQSYVMTYEDSDYKQKLYFSGRSIYVQSNINSTEIDEWDVWMNSINNDENCLYNLYYNGGYWEVDSPLLSGQDTYDYQRSHFEKLNGVFFNYQNDGSFISKLSYGDEMAKSIIPAYFKSSLSNAKNIAITIFLEDNKIHEIYLDGDKGSIAKITLETYTELPFGIVDEPAEVIY